MCACTVKEKRRKKKKKKKKKKQVEQRSSVCDADAMHSNHQPKTDKRVNTQEAGGRHPIS